MRWERSRRSSNVEVRRGSKAKTAAKGGGIGAIVIAVIMVLMGGDPSQLLNQLTGGAGGQSSQQSGKPMTAEEKKLTELIAHVLGDTEDTWDKLYPQAHGKDYDRPTLIVFQGTTPTKCGEGKAAFGPFYCPADQQVYIDLSFYDDLRRQHGAPGDFAQAYVIAHEVGHHIQTLDGTSRRVHAAKRQSSKIEANRLSVRQELQADCYAGLWAHHAQKSRNLLERGDLEEAVTAAIAIGDDTLQKRAGMRVDVHSFTHGSAKQRVKWFKVGYTQGTVAACNTF